MERGHAGGAVYLYLKRLKRKASCRVGLRAAARKRHSIISLSCRTPVLPDKNKQTVHDKKGLWTVHLTVACQPGSCPVATNLRGHTNREGLGARPCVIAVRPAPKSCHCLSQTHDWSKAGAAGPHAAQHLPHEHALQQARSKGPNGRHQQLAQTAAASANLNAPTCDSCTRASHARSASMVHCSLQVLWAYAIAAYLAGRAALRSAQSAAPGAQSPAGFGWAGGDTVAFNLKAGHAPARRIVPSTAQSPQVLLA